MILATLHWDGPLLWIGRADAEDGFGYFLYDPVDGRALSVRDGSWCYSGTPTPALSMHRVDEAEACGVAAFRADLRQVIARRDAAHLLRLIAPSAPGTDDAREAFRLAWRRTRLTALCGVELDASLDVGVCDEDEDDDFVAAFASRPWDSPPDSVVLVGRQVPLYHHPDAAARVLAYLDDAMVRPIAGDEPRQGWKAVNAGDGRTGYVPALLLRQRAAAAYFRRIKG